MWQKSVQLLTGVVYLAIIATIIAIVVAGLSAMSGDAEPFKGRRFWALVGIALAPILTLVAGVWLVRREQYLIRRSYRHAK